MKVSGNTQPVTQYTQAVTTTSALNVNPVAFALCKAENTNLELKTTVDSPNDESSCKLSNIITVTTEKDELIYEKLKIADAAAENNQSIYDSLSKNTIHVSLDGIPFIYENLESWSKEAVDLDFIIPTSEQEASCESKGTVDDNFDLGYLIPPYEEEVSYEPIKEFSIREEEEEAKEAKAVEQPPATPERKCSMSDKEKDEIYNSLTGFIYPDTLKPIFVSRFNTYVLTKNHPIHNHLQEAIKIIFVDYMDESTYPFIIINPLKDNENRIRVKNPHDNYASKVQNIINQIS